ncbi:MAG: hypothetical protein LBC18_14230 [Opitutaceae bacterium]|nr:hypothetical protein [Opitutaceae bacterium]
MNHTLNHAHTLNPPWSTPGPSVPAGGLSRLRFDGRDEGNDNKNPNRAPARAAA